MVPKSIYPISYINSGEPRWGSASSAQFRQLPQCFFPISFIHITTLNPITPSQTQNWIMTYYAMKSNYAINPKPYSYFCHHITTSVPHSAFNCANPKPQNLLHSNYDTQPNCDIPQLRQPKTPKSWYQFLTSYSIFHFIPTIISL